MDIHVHRKRSDSAWFSGVDLEPGCLVPVESLGHRRVGKHPVETPYHQSPYFNVLQLSHCGTELKSGTWSLGSAREPPSRRIRPGGYISSWLLSYHPADSIVAHQVQNITQLLQSVDITRDDAPESAPAGTLSAQAICQHTPASPRIKRSLR